MEFRRVLFRSDETFPPLLLNSDRTDEEPAIYVVPGLSGILKPHQVISRSLSRHVFCSYRAAVPKHNTSLQFMLQEEGIRFMWNNVVGALSEIEIGRESCVERVCKYL